MKLRQKLAVVLASAMIITAVPVVTSAASTNGLNQTISMVAGTEITTSSALNLNVKFDSDAAGKNTTFYVNAEDFKFNADEYKIKEDSQIAKDYVATKADLKDKEEALATAKKAYEANKEDAALKTAYEAAEVAQKEAKTAYDAAKKAFDAKDATDLVMNNMKVSVLSEDEIRVTVTGINTATTYGVPVLGTAKKGNPTLSIDGTDSFASSGKYSLATGEVVTDKNLSMTFADAKNLTVDGGSIADITINEGVAGALNATKEENRTIIVELPSSSDLEFAAKQNLEIRGLRGLAGEELEVKAELYKDEDGVVNAKKLVLVVEKTGVTTTSGKIKVGNIQVKPEGRDEAKLGDVTVKVTGEAVEEAKAVVGKVTEFGINLTVEEEVALVAGKDTKEVTVKLEEAVKDTFDARHKAYFTINGGVVNPATLTVKLNDVDVTSQYVEKDVNSKTGHLEGFEVDFAGIKADKANKFTFTFKAQGEVSDMSDIVVEGESRSFKEDVKVTVAKMTAPVTVDVEAVTVKVGLKGQEGGKITIKETDLGMIGKGELTLTMDDSIKFANKDLTVETTGTMKAEVVSVKDNQITLNIKRTSNEAGTLTLSGFKFDVDRTVPEGTEDMVLAGAAISNIKGDHITVEDFIVVGTPNTEDNNGSNGLKKGTGIFKVGEKSYTLNGETVEMDAAAYISKNNRIMVPARYVADVFGINGNDLMFSNENGGTITIFAGNRVLQVVNGSNVALVNGVKVAMTEKVSIVDGRTFVPVGEMARLLDVQVNWSNEDKTATFTN